MQVPLLFLGAGTAGSAAEHQQQVVGRQADALAQLQAGAAGYVCKQQELTELLSAIKAVLSGYSYFPNQALNSVRSTMGNASEADMVERLSGREMMVLQQLARGKTNKEIADGMFLSNKTVSTYKTRLLLKLNARSLVDLIELAQRNGLV